MKFKFQVALTVALLLLPTMAMAQPQPQVPQASDQLNFVLTPLEADKIWKALRKLPVEEVEELMTKLRQQVMDQQSKKAVEPPPAPNAVAPAVPKKE